MISASWRGLALLCGFTTAIGGVAPLSRAQAHPPPVAAQRPAVSDLPNFHQVAPGIYRGAVPTEAGLRKLRAMGVQTVIDLRISPKRVKKEGEFARSLGLNWLNLPMSGEPPTKKQVSTLLATLDQASPARPVFVHCEPGADRTGCMIGIYRVARQKWAYAPTYQEMRRYGFNPHWKKLSAAVQQRAAR